MRPVLLVVLAAVCFGTTGTAQAYGPGAASSSAVGLTRIVAGGLLLAVGAAWIASRAGAVRPVVGRSDVLVVVVGGAAVLAYQPTFFAGARLNGVAIAAVVTLGAAPVLTGVLEWLLTRTPPGPAWFAGTSCAVAGVVLVGGLLDGGDRDVGLPGLAASLGAALSYAVYTLAAKRLLVTDGWSPTVAIGSIFGVAAVLAVPFLLTVDLSWVTTTSGLGMIAWLAVVTVAAAYVLFAAGLKSLSASSVSTLTLVEPVTATLLGLLLLDEQLSTAGWAGLAALLTGVTVLAVRR